MAAKCGLHVPSKEELDALGVERHEEIPGKRVAVSRPAGMMAASGVGEKLTLPHGTPRHYPPYPGASKAWSQRSWGVVRKIREKAPGVICATYRGHGRTGEPWGIDVMISSFNVKANAAQENFGDALCNWVVGRWSELNINYVIYWNYMLDSLEGGWFSYEPYRLQWPSGSQNLVTSRHLDHVHISIDNPHVAGNE